MNGTFANREGSDSGIAARTNKKKQIENPGLKIRECNFKNTFLINQPKHMLLVLERTVLVRRILLSTQNKRKNL